MDTSVALSGFVGVANVLRETRLKEGHFDCTFVACLSSPAALGRPLAIILHRRLFRRLFEDSDFDGSAICALDRDPMSQRLTAGKLGFCPMIRFRIRHRPFAAWPLLLSAAFVGRSAPPPK